MCGPDDHPPYTIAPGAVCARCAHPYAKHGTDPRPWCSGIHDTGWTWHGCHCDAFALGAPPAHIPAPDDRNEPEE